MAETFAQTQARLAAVGVTITTADYDPIKDTIPQLQGEWQRLSDRVQDNDPTVNGIWQVYVTYRQTPRTVEIGHITLEVVDQQTRQAIGWAQMFS